MNDGTRIRGMVLHAFAVVVVVVARVFLDTLSMLKKFQTCLKPPELHHYLLNVLPCHVGSKLLELPTCSKE